ncbi:MAG: spiro-SPASM protein [Spirochaetales bacterium]|nr:spiro-SPASM protein [Spirochaetales bacterium]
MSTQIVVNSVKTNSWADRPFSDGTTASGRLASFLAAFPGFPVVELVPPGGKGRFPQIPVRECADSCSALIAAFGEIFTGADRIIYLWGDTPLADSRLTEEMEAHHHRYMSQYTFADGWPLGLTPEILEKRAMETLEPLSRGDNTPIARDSLFTLIQRDINAFDLETLIAPSDFRLLRLTLAADSKRNHLLLDRFIGEGLISGETIADKLEASQTLLRTLPAFFQIQVTEKRLQKPSYLPVPDFTDGEREMSLDELRRILDKIRDFSDDGVISLSFWGEPSAHSRIYEMMEEVVNRGFRLLIETSGLGWDRDSLRTFLQKKGDRVDWIVELDALVPALYRRLRGEGQQEVLEFIDFLGEPERGTLYVQTTRMGENEDHLEALYQAWKEKPGKLIIKKYDHFCSRMPARKVTELSPLDRNPCWHIKRDMVILRDGTVLTCQEKLDKTQSPGNILTGDIRDIWAGGEALYRDHLNGEFLSPCAECDEYYTYNF